MVEELCWCGSGKNYSDCHLMNDEKIKLLQAKGQEVPEPEMIKTKAQIEGIRKAGALNTAVLDEVAKIIKPGITTEEIDRLVYDYTIAHGGIPACLGYFGFPKSCCTSINDQVCHGIPSEKDVLKNGDIVNVDCTTIVDGFYGDASRTFIIGKANKKAVDLVEVTRQCLKLGLEAVKPWGHLGDIGAAIGQYARKRGYSVVTDFGGHGCGVEFHEEPFVCHVGKKNTGMVLVPGMTFTIEPMINMGRPDIFVDESNDWTVYTQDGSLSAQFEHTILVTETGIDILSK